MVGGRLAPPSAVSTALVDRPPPGSRIAVAAKGALARVPVAPACPRAGCVRVCAAALAAPPTIPPPSDGTARSCARCAVDNTPVCGAAALSGRCSGATASRRAVVAADGVVVADAEGGVVVVVEVGGDDVGVESGASAVVVVVIVVVVVVDDALVGPNRSDSVVSVSSKGDVDVVVVGMNGSSGTGTAEAIVHGAANSPTAATASADRTASVRTRMRRLTMDPIA